MCVNFRTFTLQYEGKKEEKKKKKKKKKVIHILKNVFLQEKTYCRIFL